MPRGQRAGRALGPVAQLIDGALDDVDRIEAGIRARQSAEKQRVETEITQVCLAVVIGSPSLGAELFEAILSGRLTSRAEVAAWCTERGARIEGTRDRLTLRYLARRDGEFTDWNMVGDAVRRWRGSRSRPEACCGITADPECQIRSNLPLLAR